MRNKPLSGLLALQLSLWPRQACTLMRSAMHHMCSGMHHVLQLKACCHRP